MKRLFAVMLSLFMLGAMLTACKKAEDPSVSDDTEWENPGFSLICGGWENSDGSVMLQINGEGQAWYIEYGDIIFRGYLDQVLLPEGDAGYEYHCRYDLYDDGDELKLSYLHDETEELLFEISTIGETVDEYEYIGGFGINKDGYAGDWYIQGVSDSYCLTVKYNDEWELRYPGADGGILCEGICEEDPFGDYEFIIDKENGVSFGSGELEDGILIVGISNTSPYRLEPFDEYYFYSAEDSSPRTSVGDYTGVWRISAMSSAVEFAEEGTWRLVSTWDQETVDGTYEIYDDGIVMSVENSNSLYFYEGEVLEFSIEADGTLYDFLNDYTLVPYYE